MKSPTLRERFRETTSNAILSAAEAVAARDGLSNASLQAIADEAGVAVGTIYNYFQDRQVLFEALFTRRRDELYLAVDTAAKAHARARFDEQLVAFVRSVLEHFDGQRTFLRLALEGDGHRPLVVKGNDGRRRPSMQQLLDRSERVLQVGVREKRVRPEAAELASLFLVSFIKGVLVARLDDPRPLASHAEGIVSLFLEGVAR